MSKTLFAACLARLGLSQTGAGQLLGIAVQGIKDMSTGRKRVPAGVWGELRAYEDRIGERSDTLGDIFEENTARAGDPPERIDAVIDDAVGLMALADFVLTHDVTPGEVQVGVLD